MEQNKINALWYHIRNNLFSPETNLIYDCRTSPDPAQRFAFLPTPEEIAIDFPNPCGWSTGMEDCMLNAGSVLDTLALERESGETDEVFAGRILDGIFRCTTVHGRPGFVARGLSPYDGRSCYSNSSRDQFSLAVYGVWRYWRVFRNAPAANREQARNILRSIAEFCETRVTPENDYDLGRLDGGRALVSKMWESAAHEALRLPMIYAAAFDATGEPHWLSLAGRYAEEGVEITRHADEKECWDIPLAQLQLSLAFFRDAGFFPELEPAVRGAMARVAEMAQREFGRILTGAETFTGDWCAQYGNWRKLPMKLTPQTLSDDGRSAIFGGKTYLNPCLDPVYARPNTLLRGLGNCLIALYSDSAAALGDDERTRFARVLDRVDFPRCSASGPVQLLHGLRLAEHRGEKFLFKQSFHSNRKETIS